MNRQIKPGQLGQGIYNITASYALAADISNVSRIVIDDVNAVVTNNTASFLITSASIQLFQITNTGIAIFATQSAELEGPAPVGGMYFTSSSFFVGLESAFD